MVSQAGHLEQRSRPARRHLLGYTQITAALELRTNQVTHFYSERKNTAEMIRMMELLVERYGDRRKLYLSWDGASWHISKRLYERIGSTTPPPSATVRSSTPPRYPRAPSSST